MSAGVIRDDATKQGGASTVDSPHAAQGARGVHSARGSRTAHGASSRGRVLVFAGVIVMIAAGTWIGFRMWNGPASMAADQPQWDIPAPFDAERAFSYLAKIVAFGPRPSGSEGMRRQQEFLQEFFQDAGAEVEMQSFDARHPESGERVVMKNLIARFRPDAKERYLLCAHYDTRPYPDRDDENPRGVFVGANDGGSGTAALMEMSHHIDRLPARIGVDVVLFDGEELVIDSSRDPYFLGSTYFARQYVAEQSRDRGRTDQPSTPAARPPYRAGVLLDMVGDRELQLFYERNSWNYAHDVTVEIWSTARRLGIDAFKPRLRHVVRDDHLPLNVIAKIPTTDIIDFDYPRPGFRYQSYWHTTEDTLDKCSGQSLVAVVYVLHTWLSSQK